MMSADRLPPSPEERAVGNVAAIVEGNSMQPTIRHGDMLPIALTEYANDNDVVLAQVGDTVHCKRITYTHDEIILSSDNPKFPPMHCKHEEIAVIGRAIKVCGLFCLLFL